MELRFLITEQEHYNPPAKLFDSARVRISAKLVTGF
jgi:hypothetical protein